MLQSWRTGLVRIVSAAAAVAASIVLAGCATSSELMSYGIETADAQVMGPAGLYSIYVHPTESKLLLQPKIGKIDGLPSRNVAVWRQVGETFVTPVGCGIEKVEALTVDGATWQAWFVCPDGVDLRGLVAAQRSDLKRGYALHR